MKTSNITNKHDSIERKCTICNQIFKSGNKLFKHLRLEHKSPQKINSIIPHNITQKLHIKEDMKLSEIFDELKREINSRCIIVNNYNGCPYGCGNYDLYEDIIEEVFNEALKMI